CHHEVVRGGGCKLHGVGEGSSLGVDHDEPESICILLCHSDKATKRKDCGWAVRRPVCLEIVFVAPEVDDRVTVIDIHNRLAKLIAKAVISTRLLCGDEDETIDSDAVTTEPIRKLNHFADRGSVIHP